MGRRNEVIPLRCTATDIQKLVTSIMAPLERQAADLDIGLTIEASPALPSDAWLDPEKIGWVIATLVGNAFRYVKRGTRRMPGGSIGVTLDFDPTTNEVIMVVADDGSGIPKDKIPFLFERAMGAPHASGLGLMLVHDVVKAHRGSIDVLSSTAGLDRGTTITIRIPAIRAPSELPGAPA